MKRQAQGIVYKKVSPYMALRVTLLHVASPEDRVLWPQVAPVIWVLR